MRNGFCGLMAALVLAGSAGPMTKACAEETVWATGRVLDAGGKPVAGALVAVYDDQNKVADYAKTDAQGEYALAVPRHLLHLDKKRVGFATQVFNGVSHFVGDAAGFVANPLRAGVHAITSSQAAGIAGGPIAQGGVLAGGVVVDQLLFKMTPQHKTPAAGARKQPGSLLIKAVAPDSHDLLGIAQVYWAQQEVFRAGGKQSKTLAVWVDPVKMAGADTETESKAASDFLRFTSARLEPSIAEVGQTVRITATLPAPPAPAVYVTVVARNNRTGQKWELAPIGNNRYAGEFTVDKRFSRDDQTISVIAYAAQPDAPGRRKNVESAIEGAGLWDARKPYHYDPLLVVSRNRADLTLTVVEPARRKR